MPDQQQRNENAAIARAVRRLLDQGYTHNEITVERNVVRGPFTMPWIVAARREPDVSLSRRSAV
jgi:hypothetical protein